MSRLAWNTALEVGPDEGLAGRAFSNREGSTAHFATFAPASVRLSALQGKMPVDSGVSIDLPSMLILPYQPDQARSVVELWRASFEYGVGIVDHHPIEEQHAFFVEQVVPHNTVRVVLEGEELIGFMACTPESIDQLYVKVASIGQGIGSTLVELAKSESSGSLWLYTFARNLRARSFYERHGFVEVERESENMWKLEAIRYCWRMGAAAT